MTAPMSGAAGIRISEIGSPLVASTTRETPSTPAVSTRRPSALKRVVVTRPSWPGRLSEVFPVSTSRSVTSPVVPPVRTRVPSGLSAPAETGSPGPPKVARTVEAVRALRSAPSASSVSRSWTASCARSTLSSGLNR